MLNNRGAPASLRMLVLALSAAPSFLLSPAEAARAQTPNTSATAASRVLYGHDFAVDASLAARPDQLLAFTSEPGENTGRFKLAAGEHRFCLSGGAGYFTALIIVDADGRAKRSTLDKEGCVRAHLPAGVVTVRLHHTGPVPPSWVTASVRADPPKFALAPPPLVNALNSPVGGYWAIQDLTFNGRGTFGNRILSEAPDPDARVLVDPSTSFDGFSLLQLPPISGAMTPAILASASSYWSTFFSYPYVDSSCGAYCADVAPPLIQIKDLGSYQFEFVINPALATATNVFGTTYVGRDDPVLLPDFNGPGDLFQVLFRFFPDATEIGPLNNGEVALYQQCNHAGKAAVFIPLLGIGVISPPYDLTALSSGATTLDGTGKSFAFGAGSGVYWGPGPSNIQGAAASPDTCVSASPSRLFFVEPLSDVLITAHDLLGKSCVACSLVAQTFNLTAGSDTANFSGWNLEGADFSHAVLSGWNLSKADLVSAKFIGASLTNIDLTGITSGGTLDFTGATLKNVSFAGASGSGVYNFSNATLTNVDLSGTGITGVNFAGATLNHVKLAGAEIGSSTFPGATFCGVNLTGTDKNHVLDLTSGSFAGAHVFLSSTCAANLSYTNFNAITAPGGSWTGFNLTGANVGGLKGQVLSTSTNPLNLGGTSLQGASLQDVVLDYATGLAGADLTEIHLNNSSLRFVDLGGAKMYGAQLNQANLEGSNMNGVFLLRLSAGATSASLGGAFLRNVNLSQAKLTGADFTSASFYSQAAVGPNLCTPDPRTHFTTTCATAAGATMDGTNFSDAYLFGVDFTNATATAVNFGGSFLAGSNFSGATIAANPAGSAGTFANTFLQGTNMSGLVLQNGVSFQGAYVDFRPDGNVLNLLLDGQHTTFPGYWNTAGEPVCAQMTYNTPTTVPVTNVQTTCPDGNQYAHGCGAATPDGSNTHWESRVNINQLASYLYDATFTKAPASGTPICNADFKWIPLNFRRTIPHPPLPRRPLPYPLIDPATNDGDPH